MLCVIDRFEGKWAVIEFNRKTFNLPRDLIPKSAKEGDVIDIKITVDKETTKKQKSDVRKLMDSLFEEE